MISCGHPCPDFLCNRAWQRLPQDAVPCFLRGNVVHIPDQMKILKHISTLRFGNEGKPKARRRMEEMPLETGSGIAASAGLSFFG